MSALDEEAEELSSSTKKRTRSRDRSPRGSGCGRLAAEVPRASGSEARRGPEAHHMGALDRAPRWRARGPPGRSRGSRVPGGAPASRRVRLGPFEPGSGPNRRTATGRGRAMRAGREPRFRRVRRIETERGDGERVDAVGQTVDDTPRNREAPPTTRTERHAPLPARRVRQRAVRQRGRSARGRRFVPAPSSVWRIWRATRAARRGDRAEGAAGHRPRPRPRAASDGGGARGAARRTGARGRRGERRRTPTRARRRRRVRLAPSAASAASDVSDSDAFPAFERDFRHDVSDGSRSAAGLASPSGTEARAPAGTRSSMAAARLLGSPQSARERESVSSLGGGGGGARAARICVGPARRGYRGVASFGAKHRRRDEARRHRARAASADVRERRRAFVYERLFRRRASRRRRRARAREFRRFVTDARFAAAAAKATSRRPTRNVRERVAGGSAGTAAVPASGVRGAASTSAVAPRAPAGAKGHGGGYDDDDELFGLGADAPKHRRLDPRLARRRVAEERATRSARARISCGSPTPSSSRPSRRSQAPRRPPA